MSINHQTKDSPKKPAAKDWHKADIKAALHKRGLTLKGLSLENQYRSVDAVAQALHRPYPKVERIIATALGIEAKEIWPSRYEGKNSTSFNAKPVKKRKAA